MLNVGGGIIMANTYTIEYKLGKVPLLGRAEGVFPQLEAVEPARAIVKGLEMWGQMDSIVFERNDGRPGGGSWNTISFGRSFQELSNYDRFKDVACCDLEKLAKRMYELCYTDVWRITREQRYAREPILSTINKKYQQMVEELGVLQQTQQRLIDAGELVLPDFILDYDKKTGKYVKVSLPLLRRLHEAGDDPEKIAQAQRDFPKGLILERI